MAKDTYSNSLPLLMQQGKASPSGTPEEVPWEAFLDLVGTHELTPPDPDLAWQDYVARWKDGTGFSAGVFTEGHRSRDHLEARTAIVLDVETHKQTGAVPPDLDTIAMVLDVFGLAGVIYTSFQHRTTASRYRIVLPLAAPKALPIQDKRLREIDKETVRLLAQRLQVGAVVDTGKIGAESFFYLPRCPEEFRDEARVVVTSGAAADDLYAELSGEAERRIEAETRAGRDAVGKSGPRGSSPTLDKARRALKPLRNVLETLGYIPEYAWNDTPPMRYLHPDSTSGSAGVAILMGEDGIERTYSHHESDPMGGGRRVYGALAHDVIDHVLFAMHGHGVNDMGSAIRGLIDSPPARFASAGAAAPKSSLPLGYEHFEADPDTNGKAFTFGPAKAGLGRVTYMQLVGMSLMVPDLAGLDRTSPLWEDVMEFFDSNRKQSELRIATLAEIQAMQRKQGPVRWHEIKALGAQRDQWTLTAGMPLTEAVSALDAALKTAEVATRVADVFAEAAVPELPVEYLPFGLADAVNQMQQSTSFDRGAYLTAWLASAAAMIGSKATLQVKSNGTWPLRLIMWVGIVGGASVNKSAPLQAAMAPVMAAQARLAEDYKIRLAREINALPKKTKPAIAEVQRTIKKHRRYFASTATIPAIMNILAEGEQDNRGVAIISDEIATWVGELEGYTGGRVSGDRSTWLSAWNGGSRHQDRVTSGSLYTENFAVSVIGTTQPKTLAKLHKKIDMEGDGLLQRFLFTCPTEDQYVSIMTDNQMPAYFRELPRFVRTGQLGDARWTLSDEAAEILDDYFRRVHEIKKVRLFQTSLREWYGKAPIHAARLAMVLEALRPRDTPPGEVVIRADAARSACSLMEHYYEPHAACVFQTLTADPQGQEDDRKIARYLLRLDSEGQRVVSTRDMSRSGPAPLKGKPSREIRDTVARLVAGGWLTPMRGEDNYVSVLDATQFEITEGISTRFSDEAERSKEIYAQVTAKLRK